MAKALYIAEKPSVAREFARALGGSFANRDGYMESEDAVVTWCVGHLVTMSYPEVYDEKYRRWSFETLPFLPSEYKYEVIPSAKKQFATVKEQLNREDVDCIYVCTDSGREGEYIYRLVAQEAGVKGKEQKRVWIDSQTEDEIRRGIREAKDLSAYDNLGASAYLRAKEDFAMGINFSRALSIRYGQQVNARLSGKYQAIAVGRVMTCVVGMVVRREREIRNFVKTPFFRVLMDMQLGGHDFDGEWRAAPGSLYENSPKLYKENGFRDKADAEELIAKLESWDPQEAVVEKIEKKTEKQNPPLLFNLAELQNECAKRFKISPEQTLQIAQELYEKKLVTYPRTDARVLSTAIAKEIEKNISGLTGYEPLAEAAKQVLDEGRHKGLEKTRYTNDKQITDHYAIIPTGQGLGALPRLSELAAAVYDRIARRFLSIFFPAAVYKKISLVTKRESESFFSSFRVLTEEGYRAILFPAKKKDGAEEETGAKSAEDEEKESGEEESEAVDEAFLAELGKLKKGSILPALGYRIKDGETSPPKRYTSGSIILAMENAGQLIEDEELRAQIKGSGIGTSATRAGILEKLFHIKYLSLNKKTQVITPTYLGEMVYDVVDTSIRSLLNPELTASWEKGLTMVANGEIASAEYMGKLEDFVGRRTEAVRAGNATSELRRRFDAVAPYYKKTK